jgi:hypothetical protein
VEMMEISKNMMMVLGVVLIVIIGVSVVLGLSNLDLRQELSLKNTKLNSTQKKLDDNLTILNEKTELLSLSNLFINTYLEGLGSYYNATEIKETADYKFNQAQTRYDDGYWSKALAWYWDAMDWYNIAWQKFNETQVIFNNAIEYEINETYLDICLIYSDIMDANSNAMIYRYEATEQYAAACEFYLENDYNAAHGSMETAELKMTYYNGEIERVEDYQYDLNILLSEIN